MKVNRFGMSQKIFESAIKLWLASQLMEASRGLVRDVDIEKSEKTVNEIEDVVRKTFPNPDQDCQDFLTTIDALRHRVNLERAGQARAAGRPS